MEACGSPGLGLGAPVIPNRLGYLGDRRQPFQQRLELEPRSTDDDGRSALRPHIVEYVAHIGQPERDRIRRDGWHMAIEPVRRLCLLFYRRPRGDARCGYLYVSGVV